MENLNLQSQWESIKNWLMLYSLNGMGNLRFLKTLDKFKTIENIINANFTDLKNILPTSLAQQISKKQFISENIKIKLDYTKKWLQSSTKHHIIHIQSPYYPQQLKQITNPPVILYTIGNIKWLSSPQIAIVGSRKPTLQGIQITRNIARDLSKSGITITSGLAIGIDAHAHQSAIDLLSPTIAVLGCGIDQIYPKCNNGLYADIKNIGVIVSEYPLGSPPKPINFPKRNRIISGLSLGVLVVEAREKSGSLISARLALEQNREVFAIPGSILNPQARGCNHLIKQGALLVESYVDILNEIKPLLTSIIGEQTTRTVKEELNSLESDILNIIIDQVFDIDHLCCLLQKKHQEVSVALLELELKGLIAHTDGGFIRIK